MRILGSEAHRHDTNAYVAFKRGDSEARAVVQCVPAIAVTPIVLGELLGGFALGSRDEVNRRELLQFVDSPRVTVLPLDRRTAEHYATIYAQLKRSGTPIPTNDLWIAAVAVQHGLPLFTFDRHFRAISGLLTVSSVAEMVGP